MDRLLFKLNELKQKFPRADALSVAKKLCDALKPVCARIIVCGSLRRRKPTVGDVEVLFVPRLETRQVDMFSCQSISLAEETVGYSWKPEFFKSAPRKPAHSHGALTISSPSIARAVSRSISSPPPRRTGGTTSCAAPAQGPAIFELPRRPASAAGNGIHTAPASADQARLTKSPAKPKSLPSSACHTPNPGNGNDYPDS